MKMVKELRKRLKMHRVAMLTLGLVVISGTTTQAITLGIEPNLQDVTLGDQVSFSVFVSGLGSGTSPSLGAFDFNVEFDPAILSFDSITFGDPILGSQLGPVFGSISDFNNDQVSGSINQFEVSLELPGTLDLLQPDTFILTNLRFNTINVGTSTLDFSNVILGDASGAALTLDTIQNGSVVVSREPTSVPEPAETGLLLGFSLLAFAAAYKRDATIEI